MYLFSAFITETRTIYNCSIQLRDSLLTSVSFLALSLIAWLGLITVALIVSSTTTSLRGMYVPGLTSGVSVKPHYLLQSQIAAFMQVNTIIP